MKVYFACITTYNIFVSYILAKTVYRDEKYEKIILVNDIHNSVVSIIDNLAGFPEVWNKIIIIKQRDKSEQQITEQLNELDLKENDILHFFSFGMQYSVLLFNIFPTKGRIIITEEGYGSYMILNFYDKWRKLIGITENIIDFNRANEIWLFDPKVSDNDLSKPLVKIDIINQLRNEDFQVEFINDLKKIFNIEDAIQTDWDIIFFDQYPSNVGMISLQAERYILKNIYNVTKEFDTLVKQHPSENDRAKYEGFPFKFIENYGCPWEILYALELLEKRKKGKKIFLTYNSMSVYNSRIMFKEYDEDIYIILLHKILDRYYLQGSDVDFINQYIAIYGQKNLYIPESFSELSRILSTILNVKDNRQVSCQKLESEMQEELLWLRKEYREIWKNEPSVKNISTLLFDCADGFSHSVEQPILTDTEAYDLVFDIPEQAQNNLKKIQWYALRGRLAQIKIDSFSYTNDDGKEHNIDLNLIIHYGQMDTQGYISFQSFDPVFFIPVTDSFKQVRIKGRWNFINGYAETIKVANQMAQSIADRLNISEQKDIMLENQLLDSLNEKEILMQQYLTLNEQYSTISEQYSTIKQRLSESLQENIYVKQMYEQQLIISQTYENSTFWKMTKPGRVMVDILKKVAGIKN